MSRTVLAAVVAVLIVALTAIALVLTGSSVDGRIRAESETQRQRASLMAAKLSELEAIDIENKAERLAGDRNFVTAIKTESANDRQTKARLAFAKFTSNDKEGAVKPDIIALVDASGNVLAMNEAPSVTPKMWKNDKGKTILPAIDVVLGHRVIISDIWNYGDKGLLKVGVAPVIDLDAPVAASDPEGVSIIGAVVVAYAQTAQEAQKDRAQLGTEVAYYDGKDVISTSFTRPNSTEEDGTRVKQLDAAFKALPDLAGVKQITLDGTEYRAIAVPLPRKSTRALDQLDPNYPKVTAGELVLAPMTDPQSPAMFIRILILMLGVGSLALAMLGMYLTHRRMLVQVDQVEMGVIDIINGNVDRTFRPVGDELDGLSNGLNVMLARLLGRPEPGEEEFDDEGNVIVPGRVDFDESADAGKGTDPDLAALAQESEPDYYKRVYTEYTGARKAAGNPDEVSFENFIAKLKVNEGKLKAQYQCRAVRFRVVSKDGKVSLKPVPIFA
jgi:hypothetical protein